MKQQPTLVIANWVHDQLIDDLAPHARVIANPSREPWSRAELIERCRKAKAEGIIAFMPESVDDAFLRACPKLRIVACALKGYDNFDVDACTRRGVWVTIVPDLLTAPTAELTVGLTIALARNVGPGEAHVRGGNFLGWRPRFYGGTLDGSVVGLVGAGAVGKAVAQRLGGFGCRMIYHDQQDLNATQEQTLGLHRVTLEELQAQSDFIILALPLTAETLHIVDARFLERMRPGSYLINPARGSLVDEQAVADALDGGRLAGYAADTFEMEDWARSDRPTEVCARLRASEQTVLTPHLGSATVEARRRIAEEAARSVLQCFRGERPDGAINQPAGRPMA